MKNEEVKKLKFFMSMFDRMHGPAQEDVEMLDLILELEKTKKFRNEQQIRYFLNKALYHGLIFERKKGVYSKV